MKKTILLTFTILSLVYGYAQNSKISLGPELGANLIPIENTNIGYNFQLGYHIGLNLNYKISDHFQLGSGVFLTQKKIIYDTQNRSSIFGLYDDLFQMSGIDTSGLDSTISALGVNTDVNETINGVVSELFIEIPLLANYKYKNFNIYAGPYAGILIMANKKEEKRTEIPLLNVIDISQFDSTGLSSFFLPPADQTTTSSESNKDNLRLFDYGFIAGIGYEMNHLHFNLMYSQGLVDYRDDKGDENTSTLKTIRLSMVYLFSLDKKVDKPTVQSPRFE